MHALKDFFVMALKLYLALIIVLLLGFHLAWGFLTFEVAGAMLLNLIPGASFSFVWGLPVAVVGLIFLLSHNSQVSIASVSATKEQKAGELNITVGRWAALAEFILAQVLYQTVFVAFHHPTLNAAAANDLLTFDYIMVVLAGFIIWFIFTFLHLIIFLIIKGRALRPSAV
jgi:hypothetical protein